MNDLSAQVSVGVVAGWLGHRVDADRSTLLVRVTPTERGMLVELRGELDLATSPTLGRTLLDAGAAGGRVFVDLRGVSFVDCGSLGEMVRVRALLRARGGELAIIHPPAMCLRILEIAELTDLLVARSTT